MSDMDKTIRQVIRKLQARDADLGLCNAELRRVQAELKVTQSLAAVISCHIISQTFAMAPINQTHRRLR